MFGYLIPNALSTRCRSVIDVNEYYCKEILDDIQHYPLRYAIVRCAFEPVIMSCRRARGTRRICHALGGRANLIGEKFPAKTSRRIQLEKGFPPRRVEFKCPFSNFQFQPYYCYCISHAMPNAIQYPIASISLRRWVGGRVEDDEDDEEGLCFHPSLTSLGSR